MARKKLNKTETIEAVITQAQNSTSMTINAVKARSKKWSVKDLKELCECVRIDPIYQ